MTSNKPFQHTFRSDGTGDDVTDCSQIADLRNIYIEASYVLGVDEQGDALTFGLDAVLTPGHPAYRAPGPDEQYCYRKGALTFAHAKRIEWIRRSFTVYADATGEEDLGHIDSLTVSDGTFTVEGDWGVVQIESRSEPSFRLDDSQ